MLCDPNENIPALFCHCARDDKLVFNSWRQVIPVGLCEANPDRHLNLYFYQGSPHFPTTVNPA